MGRPPKNKTAETPESILDRQADKGEIDPAAALEAQAEADSIAQIE